MVARVLIIGGYGNFGIYIARSLADDENIRLLIGRRSTEKATAFAATLNAVARAEGHIIDIDERVDDEIDRGLEGPGDAVLAHQAVDLGPVWPS